MLSATWGLKKAEQWLHSSWLSRTFSGDLHTDTSCFSTSCYLLQGVLLEGTVSFLLYSNIVVIFISQWSPKHFTEESKSIYYGKNTDFQGTEMRKSSGWNNLSFISQSLSVTENLADEWEIVVKVTGKMTQTLCFVFALLVCSQPI